MKRARWLPVAAPLLALACAAPAATGGALKVPPGQEFVYTGTVEYKQTVTGRDPMSMSGPVKVSALVTQADPAKGYSVVVMRSHQPERAPAPMVDVATVRYGADMAPAGPAGPTSGGIVTSVTRLLGLPLAPRAELKVGDEWRRSETQPMLLPRPVEMVYTVAGEVKVDGRDCLKIEKKAAGTLPLTHEMPRGSMELTSFSETLCVDPKTGAVVSDHVRATRRQVAGELTATTELSAALTLQETRRLSPSELASRVKQAEALERAQSLVYTMRPGDDRKKTIEEATQAVASFRQEYRDSPYTPAIEQIDRRLTALRSSMERQAKMEAMKGKPAPALMVKDLDGKEQSLGAYRGKLILLNFFASW